MTPKSLLRHKLCVSNIDDFIVGKSFQRVLMDPIIPQINPSQVKRVILCSGKVFYDLYQEREKRGLRDTLIIRLEQLYPFPHQELSQLMAAYKNASVVWCQEEPENMGAWTYMDRRLEKELITLGFARPRPSYVGRKAAASPATGFHKEHEAEQVAIVNTALTIL